MEENHGSMLDRQNDHIQTSKRFEDLRRSLIDRNLEVISELLKYSEILPKKHLAEMVIKSIRDIEDEVINEQLMKLAMAWYLEG